MHIVAPQHLVNLDEPVSRGLGVDRPRRQSNFARDMQCDAFGEVGRRFDDQWRDHVDVSAKHLVKKRKLALWREDRS